MRPVGNHQPAVEEGVATGDPYDPAQMASRSSRPRGRDLGTPIDRNLALELVRVTEGAAMSAARFMGRNQKEEADGAAVDSMRRSLGHVDMDGIVVIGEGEKDEAPMLYIGEHVGNGSAPRVDVAVDPIDGTRLVARGLPGGIATVALAERDSMYFTHVPYMEKLIVGPKAAKVIDITDTVANNLRRIARAEGRSVEDLTVVVLDRERHDKLLSDIRQAGARVKLIMDGDVAAGAMAAMEHRTGIDALMGIGGAPEAVLAACAIKCVGGGMQCRLWFRGEADRQMAASEGKTDVTEVLELDDLCSGQNVFFAATGITDGELLSGVRFLGEKASTHSLVMRSYTGTVRYVEAEHSLPRLRKRAALNAPPEGFFPG
ncbi:MAG: class II fructose-bisphosphatase [Candidatus Dormibacteria bacterium]